MKRLILFSFLLLSLISCTSKRLVTGTVKNKENPVYWPGVATLALSTIILFNINFKTQ